jgi:hypothetical protein
MCKLILKDNYSSTASKFHLEDLYRQHFEITTDTNSDGLLYVDWQDYDWAVNLNRPGIIDHLWDPMIYNRKIQDTDMLKVLRSNGWFDLVNEPLWYKSIGWDKITATNENSKTFLMLMNMKKPHRDQIWTKIQPYLDQAIYSYQGHGVSLHGESDIDRTNGNWQRHVNPKWYNLTKFSLVVESQILSNTDNTPADPSEKSLKPFAYKHPMIIWGPPMTLSWLRSWGFETFDNCIDESYDLEFNNNKRLSMIIREIERLIATPADYFVTAETQRRLDINYNRFYDIDWGLKQLEEKVFKVIKEHNAKHS